MFIQKGMYDHAQSAAKAMQVDMSDLFEAVATRCVDLTKYRGTFSSPSVSRLRGPPSALAMRYLEMTLKRHDAAKYREVVADTLFHLNLDKNAGWQMPVWLVESEMKRDAEGWIARALLWGWVEEAIDWALKLLRQVSYDVNIR